MTDDLDYIKAEAERLPNGTAAKFLAALDAMDGATEPLEGDGKRRAVDPCHYFHPNGCTCHRTSEGAEW